MTKSRSSPATAESPSTSRPEPSVESCPYALYGAEAKANVYSTYARMREDAPIVRAKTPVGGYITWFVTRYEDVDTVLKDSERFVKDPALALPPAQLSALDTAPVVRMVTDNLLNKDGEPHRRLRRIVHRALTPQLVQERAPRIQELANELLDPIVADGKMDFIQSYAYPLPLAVIADVLGIPLEQRDLFRIWSETFVRPVNDERALNTFTRHMEAFTTCVREILERGTPRSKNHLLDALRDAPAGEAPLSESEFLTMIILFIVAGHETTVNLLGNGMLALLRHPERVTELLQHPERMSQAVEELLRYDPPLDRSLTRWASRDTTLAGARLSRGDRVVVLIGGVNRDPAQFPDPDRLDFERPSVPHVTFGRGPHACPGGGLARLEGRIGLQTALERLPDLRLAVDPARLRWRDLPQMRSLKALPVTWTPALD